MTTSPTPTEPRDAHKTPGELEQEIEETRAHMAETLDLLQSRLSPGELFDEAVELTRRHGGEFLRNLGTQVENNPVPAVLATAGLVWLMAASDEAPRRRPLAKGTDGGGAGLARTTAGALGGSARGAADRARYAGERVRGAGGSVRRATGEIARGARRGGSQIGELVREQPLVLGILGMGIGAALGAAAPESRSENQWIGEASDRAKERAAEEGERQLARARDAAERVTRAADEQAQREIAIS